MTVINIAKVLPFYVNGPISGAKKPLFVDKFDLMLV